MEHSVSTLFYPKKSSKNQTDLAPIYCRITVNGKRTELSIKRSIKLSQWNSTRASKDLKDLKSYISVLENQILKIQQYFEINDEIFTAVDIKNRLLNKHKSRKTILEAFETHNELIGKLVDAKKHSLGSYRRFLRTSKHLKSYIEDVYIENDIPLLKLDQSFIIGFENFLLQNNVGNRNTVTKYLTNLQKIVRIAHSKRLIEINPFNFWKATWKKVNREFLTKEEIDAIYNQNITLKRLKTIKDVFIFCCYSGLAYCDVENLKIRDIVIGIDGKKWINTNRLKNNNRCTLPLLSIAEEIYEMYSQNKELRSRLFDLPSNQKTNAYLKEIATISGIDKNLTFHMARHSFATTVTLTNGVPISTVSKMLGHSSIKTTQIYAKVLDLKISNDMELLQNKLNKTS